jgi:hypothetical protein
MFNERDAFQLSEKGITRDLLEWQLEMFKNGVQFIDLKRAATINDGIIQMSESELEKYCNEFDLAQNIVKIKFVPASGAATRMFKDLYEYLEDSQNGDVEIKNAEVKVFFERISEFAFYSSLKEAVSLSGKSIEKLMGEKHFREIIKTLLNKSGLNYGQLPKGLLHFHKYDNEVRTPFEEHMMEGALYNISENNNVNIHYTVSPEHKDAFELLSNKKKLYYEDKYGVSYSLSFSIQKSSTDTMAVDQNNKPFRNQDQSIVFRPGGHGALLQNLNELESDIIFIKNIDNVVPEKHIKHTVIYKKALAGLLLKIRKSVFSILVELDKNQLSIKRAEEIIRFIKKELCYEPLNVPDLSDIIAITDFFKKILNRPIRVCGVVSNIGEPGGGPFWAPNSSGDISLQIVESSQVNPSDSEQLELFREATHFNPVDLVCSTKDYYSKKFDLTKFVDKNTCFISRKSKDGKELKALELPGLWNGAMADWLTIFVEVPVETFNPVKTVNDLLRKQHQ